MSEQSTTSDRTSSFFNWVSAHVKLITIVVAVLTILAAPLAAARSQDDPSFNPTGEIYDTFDLVEERFENSSPTATTLFFVEASDGGDALTADVLREFKTSSDALRSDTELSGDLAVQFSGGLDVEVDGEPAPSGPSAF